MSTTTTLAETATTLPILRAKQALAHPLSPLTAQEISSAAGVIRKSWPAKTELQFKVITLNEPPKAEVVPYLDAEHAGDSLPRISRKAWVNYYVRNTDQFHEAIVNLSTSTLERNIRLGPNIHGGGDVDEIVKVEKVGLEAAATQAEIAKLKLPQGTVVVCEPWIYGSDGVNDNERMYQCFLFIRDPSNSQEVDSCHYALPLPISPVVKASTLELVRVDIMPMGADEKVHEVQPYKLRSPSEYIPEKQKLRTDLKPLHVVQPEGTSFSVTEQGTSRVIEWQKWRFRVGFNHREGMVLYDVRYDGRSLFYRLSLSDMNIPYADPRHPFHKKSAFDLGDAGAGMTANNLKLGCDCLGSIFYLSAVLSNDKGDPMPMENVVCIHEQDAGIGWKHTNYRTGRAAVVRNRQLVLQSIMTVANYEYITAFIMTQAGELDYEVRATGILSTQPVDDGVEVPFGTVVHPGTLAVHHQHIFSLRVDPAVDGQVNRVAIDEALPMPRSDFNPHGTGYYVKETVLEESGGFDLNSATNRTFKIQNAGKRNPINNKPVAYKIQVPDFQKGLADKDSFNYKRAEFTDHNIYVTKHRDGELYAGGLYTNQSRGGTGVRSWASRKDNIRDEDIVLYIQFGMNHVPRVEDFPVMPCEIMHVALKPVNFFDKNPALDVPPSEQVFNKSNLVTEAHHQPSVEAVVNGGTCCTNR